MPALGRAPACAGSMRASDTLKLMVEAYAQWTDGERFLTGSGSGHALAVDADRERNTAPGPMELVLMGLCSCTATDVALILRKKRKHFAHLRVEAKAERAPEPPTVFTAIHLTYRVTAASPASPERAAVERAVQLSQEKYCGVAAMLKKTAAITWDVVLDAGPGSEVDAAPAKAAR